MAEEYARPERILKVASFHSPVVAAVDRDTGKVDCSALLTMGVPGHEARVFANGYGLVVNDGDERSATFRIQYSVQPAADRSQTVYGLTSASDLGIMAIRAARLAGHAADSSQESAAAKQMSSPEEAPVDVSFSAEERQLINDANQAWADFRDGNPEADKRHSAALDRLLQRNVCWGKIDEPQSDYDFHRCTSDSIQKQDGR